MLEGFLVSASKYPYSMGHPPAKRTRRYYGPGDGRRRYLLVENGDIYTLNSLEAVSVLEAFPKKGAFRWNTIARRVRERDPRIAESGLWAQAKCLINAGLLGILTPENRKVGSLNRDRIYRTELGYKVLDVDEVKQLLGGKTKSWKLYE